MTEADPASRIFAAMERRDWDGAAACLSPEAVIEWPATGERFDAAGFVAMNRAYPEGWAIEIAETVVEGDRIVARVQVTQGGRVFWCAGFYTVADGLIVRGVEHWLTEAGEDPPRWRARFWADEDR